MDKMKIYQTVIENIADETVASLREFFPPKKGRRVPGEFGLPEAIQAVVEKLTGTPAPVKRTRKPRAVAAAPKAKRGPKPKAVAAAPKKRGPKPKAAAPANGNGGRRMSPKAKASVSERMKAYWAAKRAEKANGASAETAAQ